MKVHRDLDVLPPEAKGHAVAIGNFDGVHRGHRAVVEKARELAARAAGLAVLSFEPHPKEVVSPTTAPRRLTPLRRKIELLREIGVDRLYLLRFNHRLMAMSAAAFVDEVLCRQLTLRALTCGESFRFGHKRQGDTRLLAEAAERHGFRFESVAPLLDDGVACSSTRIREALERADLATANRLLGYPFTLSGIVAHGDKRGRIIGFPTANIVPDERRQALPAQGVYAVRATQHTARGTLCYPGVANLGRRPTFGGLRLLLEVHLFDAEPDLYGARLDVAFLERLRGEMTFSSIDVLRGQITRDCREARRIHGLVLT